MPDLSSRLRHRLIPAVPAIADAAGQLNVPANERYAAWMARQDIGGVALWAHTGRGLHLTPDQRAQLLRSWRQVLGDIAIVCGAGVPHGTSLPAAGEARAQAVIDATVQMARQAKAGAADAVMVHPPPGLAGLADAEARVVQLHEAVAREGLPVLAFYLYEAAGGLAYPASAIERVLAIPGVIGIKIATLDSVMTFQDLVPVVRNEPRALLLTGEDRFLGYSLMLGADAALVGLGAACTGLSARLLAAWYAGDLETFRRYSSAVDALAHATFRAPMEGYVQRLLWALEADGVVSADPRDPFAPPLEAAERGIVAGAVLAMRFR